MTITTLDGARRIVFDIETAPHPDAPDWIGAAAVTAPRSYVDPVKIDRYVANKRQELVDRAALDPHCGRIVAIGWWDEATGITTAAVAPTEDAERDLLTQWWEVAHRGVLVGYNCLKFDLPYLLTRAGYLGVLVGRSINLNPYRGSDVIDLMLKLSFNGALANKSLAWHIQRRGLAVPADTISGADVPAAVAAGEWDLVKRHVYADVKATTALAAAMGYLPREDR